ncbi:uncharacterized protein LOC125041529 isoform X1 [Penaeus chinensis]|uniref:uncharacterized protein LOC125041529 isoform X1 n=1 Tax=Penaeus chinensis TaxID=139456 RepID=UPI001FB6098E|nr:uncharacterized protein LOC125041529 isoform X1 [Penaeus chinensis]
MYIIKSVLCLSCFHLLCSSRSPVLYGGGGGRPRHSSRSESREHAEEGEHPAKGAQVPSERGRPGERSPWPADGSAASLSQHPLSSLPYQDGSAPASAVTLAKPQPHTSAQVSRGL